MKKVLHFTNTAVSLSWNGWGIELGTCAFIWNVGPGFRFPNESMGGPALFIDIGPFHLEIGKLIYG